ncbi:MAG: hypothetical protein IPK18_04450 [Sphingobacteriales bacterium]|nr:MAG: hypothetical protein IPK18_04450 [Sphingobacteriales bacterium]
MKKYHFDIDEITQRDYLGNLIGEDKGDWTIVSYDNMDDFGKNVLDQRFDSIDYKHLLTGFKTNDTKLVGKKIIIYPNPMSNTVIGHTCPTCNTSYHSVAYLMSDKFGKKIGERAFFNLYGNSTTELPAALMKRDFYMHFIIRTSDSSIYYARGKVIGIE